MPTTEQEFIFNSRDSASAAARAVSPELTNSFERRSKTSIHTNKNVVLLKIVSNDEAAQKASLAHYSRLLGLCKNISVI